MAERLLPGLIQDTFISVQARAFDIRRGQRDGTWAVWQMGGSGYVWIADCATRETAMDLAAWMMAQHDIRPR